MIAQMIGVGNMSRAEWSHHISYYPMVTQERSKENFGFGRVTKETLDKVGVDLNSLFYLSGPGGMIPELEKVLRDLDVPDERIRYEVWWKPEH